MLKYVSTSSGRALLIIDGLVILLAAFVFSAELALYALISVYISSRVIDFVQEGGGYDKAAFIISDKEKEIAREILTTMERGATFFEGRGAYSLKEKGILLTVVSRSEVTKLKNLVSDIDPDAFVIVTNVNEVLGEGFQENVS